MADNLVFLTAFYVGDPSAGRPLSGGQVFVGVADLDPEVEANRISIDLLQEDGSTVTIPPASQPIEIGAGGYPTYNGSVVQISSSVDDYSIKILDDLGSQKFYIANAKFASGAGIYLEIANDLSDLNDPATARSNLGLGTSATQDVGTNANDIVSITVGDARYLQRSNNLSDVADAAQARQNLGISDAFLPTGYITGLDFEEGGDPLTEVQINPGSARSDANNADMVLSTAITKQIDNNWVEGDNVGGFPSALTIATGQTYNLFIISKADGTVDAGFDLSSVAANLLADATDYIYYKKIGEVYTAAASTDIGNLRQLNQTKYIMRIDDSGAAATIIEGPTGWTATHNATGEVTVTHNLGTSNYVVIPSVEVISGLNSDSQIAWENLGNNSVDFFMGRNALPNNAQFAFEITLYG